MTGKQSRSCMPERVAGHAVECPAQTFRGIGASVSGGGCGFVVLAFAFDALGLGFGGGPNAIDRVAPDFFRTVGLEKVTEI